MKSIRFNAVPGDSFMPLYRDLTRLINRVPLDPQTVTLLHQYKRYKYLNTKIKQNETYHRKMAYYYINILHHLAVKADALLVEELLNIAYLKTRSPKLRYPDWYMDFVNLNKADVNYIYEKGIWPHKHWLLEAFDSSNMKLAKKQKNIVEKMTLDYKGYLERQHKTKRDDMSILDVFPHLKDHNTTLDQDISLLLSKHPKFAVEKATFPYKNQDKIKNSIDKLSIFMRYISKSHPVASKISISPMNIVYPLTPFGKPILKCRQRNLVARKITYFKSLMYSKLEPVSEQDFKFLESVVDGELDEKMIQKHTQLDSYKWAKFKKRIKNFLVQNYCFSSEKSLELVPIFSKYRVLKSSFVENE